MRKCTAHDLYSSTGGLACGNCDWEERSGQSHHEYLREKEIEKQNSPKERARIMRKNTALMMRMDKERLARIEAEKVTV